MTQIFSNAPETTKWLQRSTLKNKFSLNQKPIQKYLQIQQAVFKKKSISIRQKYIKKYDYCADVCNESIKPDDFFEL